MALFRLSSPFHKYGNVFSQISPGALQGRWELSRGRAKRTPGKLRYTSAPRQGRGELLQPLPGCVSSFLLYPGVRFAHPRLSSIPPQREYITVFIEQSTKTPMSKMTNDK